MNAMREITRANDDGWTILSFAGARASVCVSVSLEFNHTRHENVVRELSSYC